MDVPPWPTKAVAAACVVLASISGCAVAMTGTASTALPTHTTAAVVVPTVATPLDTTRFQAAPCTMLTPAQLAAFGVHAPGGPRKDGLGLVCDWDDGGGPSGMTLTLGFVTTGGGLSGTYANRNTLDFRELPPIEGFPAVIANIARTDEAHGICSIGVGSSDAVVVTIVVQISGDEVRQPDQRDPCPRTERIATEVMKTMEVR